MEDELFRDQDFESDKVPDQFDIFEAMDRASIVLSHLNDALYNHIGLNEEEARLANTAHKALFDLYQSLGNKFFTEQEKHLPKDFNL